MDLWGWVEFIWRLLQPVGTIAMAVIMFLWWQGYRQKKDASIEAQEKQLNLKEERVKEKDEQIKSKDATIESLNATIKETEKQLESKDEQIKAVEKENAALSLYSAEIVLKQVAAQKNLYEEQIAKSEAEKIEIQAKLEATEAQLSDLQVREFMAVGEIDQLTKEAANIRDELYRKEIQISALKATEKNLSVRPAWDMFRNLASPWDSPLANDPAFRSALEEIISEKDYNAFRETMREIAEGLKTSLVTTDDEEKDE
jgi:hypothetical protein